MRPHGSDREGGSSTWHRPLNEGSVVGTAFGERVDHAGRHAGDRGGRLAGDPPPAIPGHVELELGDEAPLPRAVTLAGTGKRPRKAKNLSRRVLSRKRSAFGK
jgi:hypothetical protein